MSIPHWLLTTLAWVLSFGATATIAAWILVWRGVERSMRLVPTLRAGQAFARADPPSGRVCVLIPAHNEARVIAGLVRSLRTETYPEVEFVLALDRCTDETALIARAEIGGDPRFEIVEIDECPPDWAGKVHALHAGVTRSRAAPNARYLLFADADTMFTPECIASSLALMRQRNLDLLSLLSTLSYRTWFENVVQTAAAFELMRQYPLELANAENDRRPFANGQFMLFKRESYDAVGGHAAVRNALLEDIALARLVERKGRRGGVFIADGLFHCRMYADWAQFCRGWKRIFIEAGNREPKRLCVCARRQRWLGTILPIWMLCSCVYGVLLIAYGAAMGWALLGWSLLALAVWLGALLRIAMLSRAPAWTAPLHIAGAWLTANLLAEAARDLLAKKPTQWGGREYDVSREKV